MALRSSSAILIHNHKLLLLLREDAPGLLGANCWSLPGGIVEEGETHDEGLKRELQEEVSLVPAHLSRLGKITYPKGRVGAYYFAKLSVEEVRNLKLGNEGQKMEFFDHESIKTLFLFGFIRKLAGRCPDVLKEMLEKETPVDITGLELI